MINQVR